jgi:hypothetical protein
LSRLLAGVLVTADIILADATVSDQAQAELGMDQSTAGALDDSVWAGFGPGDHGHSVTPQMRRVGMSFIVAGCVLLLALLAGIVLDDIGIRRRQERHRKEAGAREASASPIDAGLFGVNI